MEKLAIFMMVLASTMMIWAKDVEIAIMDRAYRTIDYALKNAVHDGTLQIDKQELSEGNIIFLENPAESAIKESLQRNIPVDSLLRPTSNLLEEPLIIKDIFYLDHDYIDPDTSNTISFPKNWSYTLPDGTEFIRSIFGPSIVLIVDVSVKGGEGYKPFIVIQEYKVNL